MRTVYRVKDWAQHFENNKSRTIRVCSFVCVPNKQHGMGFCRIMAEPDGAAIYGVWAMILGACSQQQIVPRGGWLTSSGHQEGTAWAPSDLALKFRRPEAEITRALDFLSSREVHWIEKLQVHDSEQHGTQCPPSAHVVPAQCPDGVMKEGMNEGIERMNECASAPRSKSQKPTIEEVKLQAAKIGLPESEAEKFYNHYESNGWRVGRNPMRSWHHALNNWKLNSTTYGNNRQPHKQNPRNINVATDPTDQGRKIAAHLAARAGNQTSVPNHMAAQVAQTGLPLPQDPGTC